MNPDTVKIPPLSTAPRDTVAASYVWGIELETQVPTASELTVGGYHGNTVVTTAKDTTGARLDAPVAPTNPSRRWRADRDGSIQCDSGYMPCEFVSPRLSGPQDLNYALDFMRWMKAIGAKVNKSCGCHITVGLHPILGPGASEPVTVNRYIRKLVRATNYHRLALFGSTGRGRHLPNPNGVHYCAPLPPNSGDVTNALRNETNNVKRLQEFGSLGRGMLNLQKLTSAQPCVEFRLFAGTVNTLKVAHHVACVLGIMHRTATMQKPITFCTRNPHETAPAALLHLWQWLGWIQGDARSTAYGLIFEDGQRDFHHSAMRTGYAMALKFEGQFPKCKIGAQPA